jgi:hypothetical protein
VQTDGVSLARLEDSVDGVAVWHGEDVDVLCPQRIFGPVTVSPRCVRPVDALHVEVRRTALRDEHVLAAERAIDRVWVGGGAFPSRHDVDRSTPEVNVSLSE